jgi:hypothetical protein
MKRLFIVFALIVLLFLFSGCIKINVYQKVHPDGMADNTAEMDFSGFAGLSGGMGEEPIDMSTMCEQMEEQSEGQYEDFFCEVDGYVVTFGGKTNLNENPEIEFEKVEGFPFTTYKLTIQSQSLEDLSSGADTTGMPETELSTINEEQLAQMKSMGVEMNYTIEMPGTISKAEGAEVEGATAKFDLLEFFATGQTIMVVESQEINYLWVGVIGVVFVVLIVLVLFVLHKRHASFDEARVPSEESFSEDSLKPKLESKPQTPKPKLAPSPPSFTKITGGSPTEAMKASLQKNLVEGLGTSDIKIQSIYRTGTNFVAEVKISGQFFLITTNNSGEVLSYKKA